MKEEFRIYWHKPLETGLAPEEHWARHDAAVEMSELHESYMYDRRRCGSRIDVIVLDEILDELDGDGSQIDAAARSLRQNGQCAPGAYLKHRADLVTGLLLEYARHHAEQARISQYWCEELGPEWREER